MDDIITIYTREEFSEILGISTKTLSTMVKEGYISPMYMKTGGMRFAASQFYQAFEGEDIMSAAVRLGMSADAISKEIDTISYVCGNSKEEVDRKLSELKSRKTAIEKSIEIIKKLMEEGHERRSNKI